MPQGFPNKALTKLEDYGFIQSRAKGEYHANNQTMAKLLHKAIGLGTGSAADASAYDAYMAHFESAPPHVLRDCLMLETGGGFGGSGTCWWLQVGVLLRPFSVACPVCLRGICKHQGVQSHGQQARPRAQAVGVAKGLCPPVLLPCYKPLTTSTLTLC